MVESNSHKRQQTPRNSIMTTIINNSLRIYKLVKNEENEKSIKISDVINALKSKYSELDIINKIDTLTNTYNRIWTIVFKSSFDIEQLKKLDKFSSIDICGIVHVVEDASIKKEKYEQFIFRFLNLPPNFDLNKVLIK